MGDGRSAFGRALVLAALASAGCAVDLDPLPATPGGRREEPAPAAAAPEGDGGAPADPADPLTPSADGERILPGVVLLEPVLDEGGAASFGLRNEGARDLPDLILSVIFAVRGGKADAPLHPRVETVEGPLLRGETREFRVSISSLAPGESVEGFRVAPGLPEVLSAAEDGLPGTTFLGGRLECVALDVDLTSDARQVTVGLAERGADGAAAPLPPLEGQLLLGRAGRLVWIGPWILVPRGDPEAGGVRRIRWNLQDAPGIAAAVLFLRIRERR